MPRKRTAPAATASDPARADPTSPSPTSNAPANGAQQTHAPSATLDTQTISAIDQALALKDSLRLLMARTDDLVRALKLQKKRETLVESTLASLKQLQNAA